MKIFEQRRQRLMEQMAGGIAVLWGNRLGIRNGDVHFPFRQNSDFYYLTGMDEEDCALVLTPGGDDGDFHLFLRPKDPARETWDGPMIGLDAAKEVYGADQAYPIATLFDELGRLMEGRTALYAACDESPERTAQLFASMTAHRTRPKRKNPGPDTLVNLRAHLHAMRSVKSEQEVTFLRRACEITAAGHREAMRVAAPGMYEFQVQAAMEFVFRSLGSPRNGYDSIVAAGRNATILHYIQNDQALQSGDLLLIDAGAEHNYFTSDITRTFPVSGHFSPAQRSVYDIVLQAQKDAIDASVVGSTKDKVHETAVSTLIHGLLELGVLQGSVDELVESGAYKRFYMHGTGHWLGMDVHDAGLYYADGKPVVYEHGTVTTVEPGLYFGQEEDIPEEFRGIGIRIEDDILTTQDGPVNLTGAVPTDPEQVEALCCERSALAASIPKLPH